jgi:hypothetical protein
MPKVDDIMSASRMQVPEAAPGRRASETKPPEEPEEGRLLVSPALWIGGGLSILVWIAVLAWLGVI